MTMTLTLAELAGVVLASVTLAATDAAALSRLLLAWFAKRLGVEPGDVVAMNRATDGDEETSPGGEGS